MTATVKSAAAKVAALPIARWVADLIKALDDPKVRAVIYRLLVLAGPLIITEGYLTKDELAFVLGVASQILGVGLAAHNTKTTDQQGDNK